jgi:hypothetical protein
VITFYAIAVASLFVRHAPTVSQSAASHSVIDCVQGKCFHADVARSNCNIRSAGWCSSRKNAMRVIRALFETMLQALFFIAKFLYCQLFSKLQPPVALSQFWAQKTHNKST